MFDDVAMYLLLAAALGSGLLGGFYFTFSCVVMKSLGRSENGADVMRRINVDVLNVPFLGAFFGTAILSALILVYAWLHWSWPAVWPMLGGSGLYLLGSFGVTVVFNVPLNNRLARVESSAGEGEAIWRDYLVRWTRWNHLRCAASLLASACFIVAFRSS